MADTWTFSEWSVGDANPAEFIEAFHRFAEAATNLGGAHEGMILQELEDPAHFVVVRRWGGPDDVARWAGEQAGHSDELMAMVPEGGRSAIMRKVADLIGSTADSGEGV